MKWLSKNHKCSTLADPSFPDPALRLPSETELDVSPSPKEDYDRVRPDVLTGSGAAVENTPPVLAGVKNASVSVM